MCIPCANTGTSRFAKLYNRTVFRSGQFFRHSFGSALKIDDKKCRSAIAYLYNNPVEKQLATDVESGRWNYLRYAQSSHPFSTALDQSHASKAMRRAIEEVRACRKADEPLNYTQIERMTKDLTVHEKAQLTDYIINQYNCIDYAAAIHFFGSYDSLVTGCNTSTGSEYGVGEVHHKESDIIYGKITRFLRKKYSFEDVKEVFRLDESERRSLATAIARETGAPFFQAAKYFHLGKKAEGGQG